MTHRIFVPVHNHAYHSTNTSSSEAEQSIEPGHKSTQSLTISTHLRKEKRLPSITIIHHGVDGEKVPHGQARQRAIRWKTNHLRRKRYQPYPFPPLHPFAIPPNPPINHSNRGTPPATKTSYINYMKVLMLAEELNIAYDISVVDTKDKWYHSVHPERFVPTLRDQDPETNQDLYVFESTACLQYLAESYDEEGLWGGRTRAERASVLSWIAYQTAGLG
ncbi:hypothetical protein J1614_010415 [Plenodomus biglobosus]|nr:hypothetical protein J1614_010415 [Plenodomus biglobosus]